MGLGGAWAGRGWDLEAALMTLVATLLPESVALADTLAYPDHIQGSSLGMADGNVSFYFLLGSDKGSLKRAADLRKHLQRHDTDAGGRGEGRILEGHCQHLCGGDQCQIVIELASEEPLICDCEKLCTTLDELGTTERQTAFGFDFRKSLASSRNLAITTATQSLRRGTPEQVNESPDCTNATIPIYV